jgi:hypothetical protein
MEVDESGAPLNPNVRFRIWVAGHPILAALLIGVVATQMATLIGYYLIGIGLPNLPWPLFNGFLGAPTEEYGSAGSFFVGQDIHFVNGIVFTVLYVVLAYHMIPLPNTTPGNILKGLIYSTVLAIISMGFLVPYVYAPKQGYGFFSFYTPDGWKLPLAILLWHFVYGFFVGVLYDPSVRRDRVRG